MPQDWVTGTHYVCDFYTISSVAVAGCCELCRGGSCGASLAFTVDLQSAMALPFAMSTFWTSIKVESGTSIITFMFFAIDSSSDVVHLQVVEVFSKCGRLILQLVGFYKIG